MDGNFDAIGVVVEGDFGVDADVVVVVEDKNKIKIKVKKSLFDLRRRRLDQLMIWKKKLKMKIFCLIHKYVLVEIIS